MIPVTLNNIFKQILIVAFFIIIFAPSLKMIVEENALFSVAEKRTLAKFPLVPKNISQIQSFFSGMDQYLDDHFGFREWMVFRYQRELRKRFGDARNTAEVLKGENNWYFYTGNEMLEDFIGRNLRSDAELRDWIRSYREKKEWLENRGIHYLLIVPPNKTSIYSEFVGEPWSTNRGVTRFSQLKKQLSDADFSSLLDLAPPLLQKNNLDTLYYKSDTHWTSYGAFLAYQVIADKIELIFPDVYIKRDFPISPILNRKCDVNENNCGGLTQMLFDYESFTESYQVIENFPKCAQRVTSTINISNLQEGNEEAYFHTLCESAKFKAIVFRDSFFSDLEPFISENFQEVIYLWKDYDQTNIEEVMLKFKPDIVIEEKVERMLY